MEQSKDILVENLDSIQLNIATRQLITTEDAWHYSIIPKESANGQISFYIDDSKEIKSVQQELEVYLNKSIIFIPAPSNSIQKALSKYYRKPQGKEKKATDVLSGQTENFIHQLLNEAQALGSSDVHIEVFDKRGRIRFRIDGMLVERHSLKKDEYPSLVNKVKILSNLDIAEKRLPQDGRIQFTSGEKKTDVRVSILPTQFGENIVMRLLNTDQQFRGMDEIGLSQEEKKRYLMGVQKTNGIVLISGPTGSGKTTTLYATLNILNLEKSKILTVEDPVEYTIPGITQVQVKEGIGYTFARALRTFLRQDPDIIMLGEIRDEETAQMAIRASLTGHLVLSTIHTNSAWGTVSRLIDMNIPPFLLADSLNTTVAQRLVRLLCTNCKKQVPLEPGVLPDNFKKETLNNQYLAVGCPECYYTGYRGRKAIYEVIAIDQYLSQKIKRKDLDILPYLKEKNIPTLAENALELFKQGKTSLEEVYSILITEQ